MKGQTKKFGVDEGQVLTLIPDGARANSDFCPDASHVWCCMQQPDGLGLIMS